MLITDMLIFQLHLPHVIPNSMQTLHTLSHSEIKNKLLGRICMYVATSTHVYPIIMFLKYLLWHGAICIHVYLILNKNTQV